ncbi:hypothetical protein PTNB73_04512 [Pyrenophora teres f. teres]|nr:hypothetical protein HRS9139_04654 [Pyrenophora teres f. teres]KAE8840106.1 hypothetical protein HRS9122_06711 [Pyrenophora teres f. teres]KAE8869459.1 hypothetical protein PTNB73_04512 [Pyrenophora teres f. teres]
MDTDITALIREATGGKATAGTFTVRIGLSPSLTHKIRGVPAAQNLWRATQEKVHQIAAQYKTSKSIRAALEARPSLLYDITDGPLRDYGPEIWNDEAEEGIFVTKVNRPMYPKRLVYKNPRDQLKIRKQLFGWVVQRACRRTGGLGGTGLKKLNHVIPPIRPRIAKAVLIPPTVQDARQVASFSNIDEDSMDELILVKSKATESRRDGPTDTANVKLPPSTKKTRTALSNTHKQRSEEEVCEEEFLADPATGVAATPAVKKRGRTRSTNKTDINPLPSRRKKKQRNQLMIVQSGSDVGSAVQKTSSGTHQELNVQAPQSEHSQRERVRLASTLLLVLERHDPGTHDIEDLQQTILLTTSILQNDSHRLQTTLGHAYEPCQKALDRGLTCLQTVATFRQVINFTGDAAARATFCAQTLTPEQKKSARSSLIHMVRKRSEWESESDFAEGFSRDLALLLLEMTSWCDIPMSFPEMQEYLLPFNERLLAWFS